MQRSGSRRHPVVERVLRACILVSAGMSASGMAQASHAPGEPYVPASDTTVLEHLPSTGDPRVRRFDAIRRQVIAKPGDPRLAVALAHAYID